MSDPSEIAKNALVQLQSLMESGCIKKTTMASSHNDLSKVDTAQIRQRLLSMRTELEKRRSDRDLLDLKRVEAALNRMARGVYGACESCTRPMIKARLLAAPHVRYCAPCSEGAIRVPSRPMDLSKTSA
jgi:RNA polymerase-binding transcription factor DksA